MSRFPQRPCPRWRQAFLTLVALYPAVLATDVVLVPHVRDLPRPLGVLASVAPVVVAMTYVLVPLVSHVAASVTRRAC